MVLDPEEAQILRDTHTMVQRLDTVVREKIVPAIYGDNQVPGLVSDVARLKDDASRVRGALWTVGVLFTVLIFVVGSVLAL